MGTTNKLVRSCVLAGFCRHPEGKITVHPNEFGRVLHELGVQQFPRHQVRRALDSLAHNADPDKRRLDRYALGDGVRVYVLKDRVAKPVEPRRPRWRFAQ